MSNAAFRFQPLLDLAEQREEQQMLALAAVAQAEASAQAALDVLRGEREQQLAALEADGGAVDPAARQAAIAYVEHLDQRIAEQAAVVAETQRRVDVERSVLVEIVQERRSFDRLRERDAAQAAEEAGRLEANVVDELTMARHARRVQGGKGAV